MHVLDAGLITSIAACSYSYLCLLTLPPSFLGHRPPRRAWAASASVLSTAGALSSDYPPIKMDWNLAFLSSGIVTSPKMVKLTTNNIPITPRPLVANTGG